MKNNLIETFLDKRLITSPNTRKNYRVSIENYFKLIGEDINTYFNNGNTLEKYENDLNKVYMIHEKNGKPYQSRRVYFSGIKQFMITYDKRLRDLEFWEILKNRVKGSEPVSDECILNKQDIKEILSHGNTLSRALFLTLTSSGRRIGEILAITPEDIDLTRTPATINIKKGVVGKHIAYTTKTKQKTITFISEEAKEALIAWLKERDTYLKHAINRSHIHKKNPDDNRIFPMGYDNALYIWKKLIIKGGIDSKFAGKDKKTKRIICHPHILRKYHNGYLGDSNLANFLEGHSTQMTRAYDKMTIEDRGAKYLACMENVTFFSNTPDLTETHKEIEQLKNDNEKLKELYEKMQMKMDILETKYELEKQKNGKKNNI